MKVKTILIAAIILALLIWPLNEIAAKCALPPGVKAQFNQATAVFLGKVIEEEERKLPEPIGPFRLDRVQVYKFKVEQWWKGSNTEKIEIFVVKWKTPNGQYVLGPEQVHFRKGERYLVYGFSDGKRLFASGCTRTKNAEYAEEDIRVLGTGQPPNLLSKQRKFAVVSLQRLCYISPRFLPPLAKPL